VSEKTEDSDRKVVLITGATRGIGRAIALGFAEEGAVIGVNGRNEALIREVSQKIEDLGGKAVDCRADVSDSKQVAQMAENFLKQTGRIDVLVNNAGMYEIVSFRDLTEERWDRVMAINLKGTFNCTKAFIETMIEQGQGKIINLGSIAGKTGSAMPLCHYAASKAGVICFTKSIATEMAPHGINVNCVCPGVIDTDMTVDIVEEKRGLIPLGIGEPEDVANAVLFLASDKADYITGEIIDVNGGLLMD